MNTSFPASTATPASASSHFLSSDWDSLGSSGISPLFVSGFSNTEQSRQEFIRGLELLALTTVYPAQLVVSDAVGSLDDDGFPLNSTVAICIPRRAGKTTAVWAMILGRMLSRPNYKVTFTAQSGIKAEERFLRDVVDRLEARWDLTDDAAPVKVGRAPGKVYLLVKATGSRLTIRAPKSENMRGDSNDLTVIDEAQEFEPTESELLLGAILPTFDTQPGAQLIITGTAGEHRSGLLWDTLQQGREGKAGVGIVEYAADPEGVTIHEDGDPEPGTTRDPEVWEAAHPGIGFATRLQVVRERAERLPHAQFIREYLGLWPTGATSGFMSAQRWLAATQEALPARPGKFALAYAAHAERVCASVGVAWRDEAGVAHVGLLQHRSGIAWLPDYLMNVSRFLKVPLYYDKTGSGESITANTLNMQPSRPNLQPVGWFEKSDGAQLIMKELDSGNLRHYDQPNLNRAVEVAAKRGPADSKRWTFAGRRGQPADDITPLEACALALWAFDQLPEETGFIFAA